MAVILVTFDCGHTQEFTGGEQAPTCGQCANTRIATVEAPLPRFTGHVQGPHAEYANLPAQAVTFDGDQH